MHNRLWWLLLITIPFTGFLYPIDVAPDFYRQYIDSLSACALPAEGGDRSSALEHEQSAVERIIARYCFYRSPAERRRLVDIIVDRGLAYGVSPKFVAAVIAIESSFYPYALSNMGAKGLMQVTDDTAAYLIRRHRLTFSQPLDLYDEQVSIELGVCYIRELILRYGSVKRAMTAYNYGPGRVDSFLANRRTVPAKYYLDIMNQLS